mmetsp:Transcript_17545/g.42841  ORF Transcript_17545/g.42841 Transcript_17545/m.42841 type:complete len:304 (+) Transcript_17545:76-987(+)|eukprot:CAMPEP_0206230458 /NCGR_PEP_ID=MMETSP0047_2-20121206/10273_1 /ASSEMBLY_ACC=CAM_ASM_000192 /TAXON_ID=195065 /ORGANISM="Chroomonas mesostigmatica_cf, Strain CCMP1168" /LENGTH=303 /DNA_ID=CAMNT_0053653889 /DNA_START=49 /DNA_END=960 /DNA_ORIENTATION=+
MPPKRKAPAAPPKDGGAEAKKAKTEPKTKPKAEPKGKAKGGKAGKAEPKEGERKSSRERKTVASYAEDDIADEVAKPRPGSYPAPQDPPGMKSTAYMCKHPGVPAPSAEVLPKRAPPPKRNAQGEFVFADYPNFTPNQSPCEVLKDGAFGGTYFRKIHSWVTGEVHADAHKEFPQEWFKGVPARAISNGKYNADVNKWGVECGGALDMWESHGWISNIDPFGWFQWYCRFFLGRRSTDDARQISRWSGVAGPKGRFRNQLINKVIAAGRAHNDPNISPVIRQTLHHWAYELTEQDLEKARKGK